MYSIWKKQDDGEYERMEYVAFRQIWDAKRFVYELKRSAELYLGLHDVHYSFEIRRA